MTNRPLACARVRERLARQHGDHCPCCYAVMRQGPSVSERKRSGGWADALAARTKAHLYHRGDSRDSRCLWIAACRRCNEDQSRLSLEEWLLILDHRGDPRAPHVRALVNTLIAAGVLP